MLKLIKTNIKALFTAHTLSKFMFLIQFILLTNIYGPKGIGRYALIFSYSMLIGTILDLGITSLIVRDVAAKKKNAKQYFAASLGLKVVINIVLLGVLAIALNLNILNFKNFVNLCLAFIIANLDSIIQTTNSLLKAFEKMKIEANIIILHNSLITGLVLIAIFTSKNIIFVPIMFIIAKLIISIISIMIAKRERIFHIEFNHRTIVKITKRGIPFLLEGFGILIIYKLDIIMLNIFHGDYITGLYEIPLSLIRNFEIFILVIASSFIPKMTQMYSKNAFQKFERLQLKLTQYVILVASLIIITVLISREFLFEKIFNINYHEISSVVPLLLISVFFMCIIGANSAILISQKKEKSNLALILIASLINIILNYKLIPSLSMMGAGISTNITFLSLFLMQLYILRQNKMTKHNISKS